jgi:hypothetical protein
MGPDTSLQMNMHSPADSHSSKTPALLLFSRPECHLYRPDIKAELFWPFGAEQLQQFLELKE